ncbi:carbohydrate binding domain-containing protein [Microbacterium aurantiacum]|uniref:carbohydrate binding domain-containing protein n=6 Tax=Microbacterium aurantiacum TaxID=162393 RepID=UPI004037AF7D
MRRIIGLRAVAAAALASLLGAGLVPTAATAAEGTVTTLYDYETGDSTHIQWGAAGAGIQPVAEAGTGSWSDTEPNERVLSYGFDLTADPFFGGIGYEFTGGAPAQDWSAYDGVQFWMHSDGADATIQVEILDAVSGSSAVHDRWDVDVPLGAAGWRLVQLPFSAFSYGTDYQDSGAPADGTLDLDFVRGLLFPAVSGKATIKLDEVSLYAGADVAPSIGVTTTSLSVTEGEDAVIPVRLSAASASEVTVSVSTEDGSAVAGTDYTAVTETLTLAAGEQDAQITVPTTGDDVARGNRSFAVVLSDASGATLGASRAEILIRDDDEVAAGELSLLTDVVEDFEAELVLGNPAAVPPLGWFSAQGAGNVPTFERSVDAGRPGAGSDNDVLALSMNTASWAVVIDTFTEDGSSWQTQDWSDARGVGFWMRGSNSGAPMFVDLLDNRNPDSTVDDAERFSVRFGDDWSGWRFVELPFADFTRKNIGNGAPDDGLTLTEMHGFGIGVEQTSPAVTADIAIDDISLVKYQRVVEDFEAELVLGDPAAVPPLGWFSAQGAGNVPTFERSVDAGRPGAGSDNDVLALSMNTASWAVVIDTFTEDGSSWQTQDWSDARGVGFWMRGSNSGAPMFVDLLDNRNPDSTVDDAERFSVRFVDDWSGWRFVELPFADFTRKNIGNGAPDDGLTLTEMHGFGIGVEQTSPAVTADIAIDDITLVGASDANRPVVINTARAIFTVAEGEDAEVTVRLTRAADADVTVDFTTEEATDRTSTEDPSATADRDYVTTSGTVTIPAGERDATITVPTIADGKAEVDETFLVRLSNPVGAELNPLALARVSIVDADPAIPGIIDDFEKGTAGLDPVGAATLSTREIAETDADAYADQARWDNVLDVTVGGDGTGGFGRTFPEPRDMSDQAGLGFWFQGQGDGGEVTVRVQDGEPVAAASEDWELRWSDEFDAAAGTPADPRYWTYEIGGWGWGNDELQYYTDSTDNAAHDGEGNMVITTRAVEDPAAAGLECWYGDCEYTSARLVTEDKLEVKHGRIEARAQMPDGEAGIWPAIWSLGNDFREVGWPRTGEIDIMEFVGKLPEEIFGTIHGPGYSGGQAYGNTYDFGENLGGQWLTFSVEWEEGEIRWYVQRDGGEEILFHTATPEDVAPSDWVYEHPFFLIMNMAVGGNFGGPLADTLTFPQELKVDYIRVFQGPDTAERFETTFVDDEAGWRFVELPFEAFDRAAEQPDGAADDGFGRTAVTGYEILVDGAVSVDRVQTLAEISDPTPGPGDGDGDGGPGDGDGDGSTPGTGSGSTPGTGTGTGSGTGSGDLAVTGGGNGLVGAMIAALLLLLGAVLVRRKVGRA